MITLPVTELTGVGPTLASRLKRLGIRTCGDLLHHYPFRYEDFSSTKRISELRDGDEVTVKGTIELIANKKSAKKHMILTEAIISDGSEQLRVVWFRQPFLTKTLAVGDVVYLSGKVSSDYFGTQMKNPSYEKEKASTAHTARIVPIYSLTSGITQKQIRNLTKQAVDLFDEMEDWLPKNVRERAGVIDLIKAIKEIHFPGSHEALRHAQNRVKFDELFVLQLRAEMVRQSLTRAEAPILSFHEDETKAFVRSIGFTLTNAQKIAAWEILRDMQRHVPMNRLLEGDVGSGKTVVAAMALYSTVLNGKQGVFMAPTEILARQHFESLRALFENRDMNIALYTRTDVMTSNQAATAGSKNTKSGKKRQLIEDISSGGIDIIIGTHALLVEKVRFHDLGLIIVDEQHRFGVRQRKVIKEKSGDETTTPHFLSMTATPIPRSFALTLYGDLDLSIIDEMPPGRKPVRTSVIDASSRSAAYGFIRDEVRAGRQIFVVCPRIDAEGKEVGDKKSVVAEFDRLNTDVFPDLEVAMLHGKMKTEEKRSVMERFASGEVQILVSTSVIEVGVDIPNASVMMIEDAERFGLAQLHQFRGRVGRSEHQAYCLLFTDSTSVEVTERLRYFSEHTSGFDVAEYDLEKRGPGQVYGVEQSGMMNFRLASMRDTDIIRKTREIAKGIDFDKYPLFREKVVEWEDTVHLE